VPMTIVIPWVRSRCSLKLAPIADAATRTFFVLFTCKYTIPHAYCMYAINRSVKFLVFSIQ